MVTHRPGASQAQLWVGCLLPPEATPARYELMAELAEERLHRVLRDQLGATYGVYGTVEVHRGGSAHAEWYTAVENGKLEKALSTVASTFAGLDESRDAKALAAVRWRAAHADALETTTSASLAGRLLWAAARASWTSRR